MAIHLEDRIAKMINGEMNRLNHKHESKSECIVNQMWWSRVMEPALPPNFDFQEDLYRLLPSLPFPVVGDDDDAIVVGQVMAGFTSGADWSVSVSSPRQRKDKRMARDDPMRYRTDRCVSTGKCDVFEVNQVLK
ncbi:hypothetical protein ACHAW5_007680 [Stephanodiscus triporus]|uniref:Uncharacterized protein n=1 Tax=Stephanodiscus triporus TaxID=2934178 RepID=A0ABD3NHU8_9STRA